MSGRHCRIVKSTWVLEITVKGKERSHSDMLRSQFIRYLRDKCTFTNCAKASEKWINLVTSKNLRIAVTEWRHTELMYRCFRVLFWTAKWFYSNVDVSTGWAAVRAVAWSVAWCPLLQLKGKSVPQQARGAQRVPGS